MSSYSCEHCKKVFHSLSEAEANRSKCKEDDNRRYQHVLETVLAPTKGIDRRTLTAERALVQSCWHKKAMCLYEAPPLNCLRNETSNKRKARHLRVHRALQSQEERTARLSKERDEKRQKRADIKAGVYKRKYKTKNVEKQRENDRQKDVCLCCHKKIGSAGHFQF
jgi:hypothetical protein